MTGARKKVGKNIGPDYVIWALLCSSFPLSFHGYDWVSLIFQGVFFASSTKGVGSFATTLCRNVWWGSYLTKFLIINANFLFMRPLYISRILVRIHTFSMGKSCYTYFLLVTSTRTKRTLIGHAPIPRGIPRACWRSLGSPNQMQVTSPIVRHQEKVCLRQPGRISKRHEIMAIHGRQWPAV